MTPVALYHRVSTLDQDPTLARNELRQAAAGMGMTVVMDVEEAGSGAKNNRPGLQRVLAAARRGEVKAILVWKLDRFGRSALDLLGNIRALEEAGCRFVVVTQGLDIKPGGDAINRLLLTMLAGVAEFERELIRERTMLGLEAARKRGRVLGRPFVKADTARIKELRAEGASWTKIAREARCTVATARRRAVG